MTAVPAWICWDVLQSWRLPTALTPLVAVASGTVAMQANLRTGPGVRAK